MRVAAIQCVSCGDIIYSRTRHDFHFCSCGDISIDGGRNYIHMSFKNKQPEVFDLEVDADDKTLYDDWNEHIDRYGLVKKEN